MVNQEGESGSEGQGQTRRVKVSFPCVGAWTSWQQGVRSLKARRQGYNLSFVVALYSFLYLKGTPSLLPSNPLV